MKKYNVGILGATGIVGLEYLKIFDLVDFPINNIYFYASAKSVGATINFRGKDYSVIEATLDNIKDIDILFSSAGEAISKELVPALAKRGIISIDNTNAFRMDSGVPLIVPEVNREALRGHNNIIANPNCSTAQLVVALKPLHDAFRIKRVVVSTYQSVSGAGKDAVEDLTNQSKHYFDPAHNVPNRYLPYDIAFNLIPQIDSFADSDYTKEELKMTNETTKIMGEKIPLTATCVRVPVYRCHSESVNIEFEKPVSAEQAKDILAKAPGVKVVDDVANKIYPMPRGSENTGNTFVGRIRVDSTVPHGLNMWVVSDNIWKGAAYNSIQIAQEMIKMKLI